MAEGGENKVPEKAEEGEKGEKEVKNLTKAFKAFVISASGGKHLPPAEQSKMTGKAANKMIKDAKLPIKSQSADIAFSKVKEKGKPFLLIKDFKHFIRQLAIEHARDKAKNPRLPEDDPSVVELEKEFTELIRNSEPKQHGTTKTVKSDAMSRLTDTKGYTGSHKERFDDSGKGKGVAGRKNLVNKDGYVTGYKEKDTYDAAKK